MHNISNQDIEKWISKSSVRKFNFYDVESLEELSGNIERLVKENPEKIRDSVIIILQNALDGETFNQVFNGIDELSETTLTMAEITNDNILRLCGRYYLSILASKNGDGQKANELALSILEYFEKMPYNLKEYCILLGLISWANSQYRSGRHIEAISCIIVAIDCSLELNEPFPIISEGLNIVGRFLIDEFEAFSNDELLFWSEVKDKIGNYNEFFYEFLNNDYNSTIKSLINKIELEENKDEDWAGHIVNLISMYSRNNEHEKAFKVMEKHSNKALIHLKSRKDVLFHILYNWSWIYFTNIRSGGINSIFKAYNLIELSVSALEEFRGSYSHKEERSAFGSISSEIYRYYLGVCCVLMQFLPQDSSMIEYLHNKISKILPNICPRTMLEQKNYYEAAQLSDEAAQLQNEQNFAIAEYNNIFNKNSADYELLSEKAKVTQELSEKLRKIHPHYLALNNLISLDINEIKGYLGIGELFFQYAITPVGIVTLLITKDNIYINQSSYDSAFNRIEELAEQFSILMQTMTSYDNEKSEYLISTISRFIAKDLINLVTNKKIKRVYCVPDFKMRMFPLVAVQIDGKKLIYYVDSIINLIDYACFKNIKMKSCVTGIVHRIVGEMSDSELNKINSWLCENINHKCVIDNNASDDISSLSTYYQIDAINTVAIYSHGVSDPIAGVLYGAKSIEGENSILNFEKIIETIAEYNNFILISCRGGSPDYNKTDEFTGIWSVVFERFSGNIILCKWDVITKDTLELLQEMFNECLKNGTPISEALILAQRYKEQKSPNPQLWAGIELWIN